MKKYWKHISLVARLAVGVGLFYYILTTTGDLSALKVLVHKWWILGAMMTLPFLGAILESARLRVLFNAQGMRFTLPRLYQFIAVANFFNYVMPGGVGGDLVKLYYLASEQKGRALETATVLAVDRAVALFTWLLLLIAFAALNASAVASRVSLLLMAATAVGVMLALIGVAVLSASERLRRTVLFRYLTTRAPLHAHIKRISDALYAYRDRQHVLLQAVLLSLPGHLFLAVAFSAAASVLIPQAPVLLVGLLTFIGLLANMLPITPGGLGVGEAAFHKLFTLFGHAGGAYLLLSWRLAVLPFGLAGGLLYMFGIRNKRWGIKEAALRAEAQRHGMTPLTRS